MSSLPWGTSMRPMSRALNTWWNQRVPIAPAERQTLLAAYRGWAAQRGLVAERHDACFGGEVSGCRVLVETGVRESGVYDVVIGITIDATLPIGLARPSPLGPFASTFADPRVLSVRVLEEGLEVRLAPASSPGSVERAIAVTIAACRSVHSAGSYR